MCKQFFGASFPRYLYTGGFDNGGTKHCLEISKKHVEFLLSGQQVSQWEKINLLPCKSSLMQAIINFSSVKHDVSILILKAY